MFQSHLYRIMHNKLSRFAFILILAFPLIDLYQLITQYRENFHPADAFFLTGQSLGHAAQILLLWFLPIYFLLLGSEDAIQDKKTGYRNILISKIGRKKYCLEKLLTSFIVSSSTLFIALLVDFILDFIFFVGGTSMGGNEDIKDPSNILFTISMDHKYLAILCFSIAASIIAGFAGVLGASASLFFADRKYAYTSAFFIWFFLVLGDHSLMLVFQPFTEYGFHVLIPIYFFALAVFLAVPVFTFFYELKFNDI